MEEAEGKSWRTQEITSLPFCDVRSHVQGEIARGKVGETPVLSRSRLLHLNNLGRQIIHTVQLVSAVCKRLSDASLPKKMTL